MDKVEKEIVAPKTRMETKKRSGEEVFRDIFWKVFILLIVFGSIAINIYAFVSYNSEWKGKAISATTTALAEHLDVDVSKIPEPFQVTNYSNDVLPAHGVKLEPEELKAYEVMYLYEDTLYEVWYSYEENGFGFIFEEAYVVDRENE
ncbi:hypothetical protein CV093_06015 [Oceanobacillus sp. 143]|uniref:Uncharacterized protein n=1 Tax=Oceanobacillus zhaokaii TaxID=2052660 RepID=A0A345PEL3_9BACI|nr:hypothetical protein [Oceanobacillus zhaokaii]AXI08443.1 hypothetical protein CUC15_05710 [Oceanobacillus zhaokaii]QGS68308.1 hypothetical protein CV093_06015 [Oceanobacillus sp. 143]